MASGKITLNTPKGTVEGYIKWSSETGPVAGNYSLVSASIYLRKTDGYTSWGTFSGSLKIAGNSYNFSKYVTLGSSYVLLTSKKDVKVSHNSDGTKNITIGTSFKIPDTTIAGTYSASKSVALDTIKRLSYCSGPFDIKAGEKFTMNITRYASSHLHDVTIRCDGQIIRQVKNYGEQINFNSDEFHDHVFKALNGSLSKKCTIELVTKSGGVELGSYTYEGTVTAQSPGMAGAVLTSAYIGQTQTISVLQPCSLYSYEASYDFAAVSDVDIPLAGETAARLPIDSVFAGNMPADVSEAECRVKFTAYYGENPVGKPMEVRFAVLLPDSMRTIIFDETSPVYTFLNSDITGSSRKFINGAGTIRMVIPEEKKAQTLYQAYITGYRLKMGDKTVTMTGNDSGDLPLTLTAGTGRLIELLLMDSRGNSKLCTYTISEEDFIQYTPLQVTACSIYRENGFDTSVKVRIEGQAWNGNFGAVYNAVTFRYRVKKSGGGDFVTLPELNIPLQADGSFSGTYNLQSENGSSIFDLDSAYLIEAEAADKVTSFTKSVTVNSAIIGMYLKRNQDQYHLGVNLRPDDAEMRAETDKAGLTVKGSFDLLGDADFLGDVNIGGSLFMGGFLSPVITKAGEGYVQMDLGTHIFSVNFGKLLAQVTATNTPVATPLSFEPGLFSETPIITLAPRSSVIGSVIKGVSFSGESKDGCDIYVNRTNSTNFYVHWTAVSITAK